MKKLRLFRKVAAWVVCALLACSMTPAVALAGAEGNAAGAASGGAGASLEGAGSAALVEGASDVQPTAKPTLTLTRALVTPLVLKEGSTYSLGAEASSGAKVTYRSSAPEMVSVTKDGTLKARATGIAVVQAIAKSSGGATKQTVRVKVVSAGDYKAVSSISSKVATTSLTIEESATIKTTFSPGNASNKNLVYKNLTPKTIFVSARGVVSAKATGAAKVRVSSAENPKATCTVAFKVVPDAGVKEYTWAQLKKISQKIAAAKSDSAGLAIAKKRGLVNAKGKLTGATKSLELTDGTKVKVRILGFRHDKLASGGVSGISFEFADVPATHSMNGKSTNEGGWALSKMRSWLNSDFYKMLPSDLRSCIAPAKKWTNNVGKVGSSDTGAVSASKDKLWLLSSAEVYGDCGSAVYNAEGSQYKLYSDNMVTTSNYSFCKKTGANSRWWLRSPNAGSSGSFRRVYSDGDWGIDGAYYTLGVSPGFCF